MRLIVGLGNPGPRYADNRHNIGFLAVDEIVRRYSFGPIKTKFHGAIAEGNIGSEKVICLCPTTFMNESGRAVQAAMRLGAEGIRINCSLPSPTQTPMMDTFQATSGKDVIDAMSATMNATD